MVVSSRAISAYRSSIKNSSHVDLNAANNLFGTIAEGRLPIATSKQFIPVDGNGGTMYVDGTEHRAKWLGLDFKPMQFWAYNFCSPLAAVIDRLSEADTNGKICILNTDGSLNTTYTKNPKLNRVMNLLKNPNPLQTWEEFNSQQVVLCKIFGYCPVFALGPGFSDKTSTKYLWNLNPFYCTPRQNTEFDLYGNTAEDIIAGIDRTNPIKEWVISIFGKNYIIPASDIILVKDGFIDANIQLMGLPISKVAGLDYFVSNICAAMEADNVLLKKKGPLGVFSYDAKPDMAGWTPMSTKMKDDVQNDLQRYGLTWGQLQYVVSKTPIKWNSMSYNLQELMTKETVRQGIDGICDRFGYPAELMSGKNATYENRNSAEKFLYQNNVIPFSLRRMARYCQFFDVEGLALDYNHLPVLQEDIMKAGEARKALSESLQIDWTTGIISYNQYLNELGLPEIAGKEMYYYVDWLRDNKDIVQPKVVNVATDVQTKSNAAAA